MPVVVLETVRSTAVVSDGGGGDVRRGEQEVLELARALDRPTAVMGMKELD
jgi:hypothetical protein